MTTKVSGTFKPQRADRVMSDDLLDREARQALSKFSQGLEVAVFEANRETISRKLGALPRESFLRLAVKVADTRADYLQVALEVAKGDGLPRPADIERLRKLRETYEEMVDAFEAMERVIERGYISLPRE
jgi:hypothetical protein